MKNDLQKIPGIGDVTSSKLRERFPTQSDLNDASLEELTEIPRISSEFAIHIMAVVCEHGEGDYAVDESVPRLAERYPVNDEAVQMLMSQIETRNTGRETDVEKLIRHSMAAHNLPFGRYRRAFENHCKLIENEIPEYPGNYPLVEVEWASQEAVENWEKRVRDRQIRKRQDRQMNDIGGFMAVFLSEEGPFGTKLDAIMALRLAFEQSTQKPLRGYQIAEYVGCSSGYANEFETLQIYGTSVVLRKEYAAQRQLNKAETWQRDAVLKRDGNQCVRCNTSTNLVVHHIQPLKPGGTDDLENMATLCRSCHQASHGGNTSSPGLVYNPGEFWDWIEDFSG